MSASVMLAIDCTQLVSTRPSKSGILLSLVTLPVWRLFDINPMSNYLRYLHQSSNILAKCQRTLEASIPIYDLLDSKPWVAPKTTLQSPRAWKVKVYPSSLLLGTIRGTSYLVPSKRRHSSRPMDPIVRKLGRQYCYGEGLQNCTRHSIEMYCSYTR